MYCASTDPIQVFTVNQYFRELYILVKYIQNVHWAKVPIINVQVQVVKI
jgi:hypothetical protein